jgi:hypothetical protein
LYLHERTTPVGGYDSPDVYKLRKLIIPLTDIAAGDFTFTISATKPPKSDLIESQLPAAIANKKRSATRSTHLGQRIYTDTRSNAATIGSLKKQFEVGQILEFALGVPSTVQPMLVSNTLEIRHNTNILDLKSLGVSQIQSDYVDKLASDQFIALNSELDRLRQARIDTETAITENQKDQNEAQKAIAALNQLSQTDTIQKILKTLQDKLSELISDAVILIDMANEQSTNASIVANKILAVAQMVR